MRSTRLAVVVGVVVLAACSSGSKGSTVTGFIEPCVGSAPSSSAVRYAAGTVVALRGVAHLQPVPGGDKEVLPTEVAARTHVEVNGAYRFSLSPGQYVIVGTYDDSGGMQTSISITVPAARTTLHRDLPDDCK